MPVKALRNWTYLIRYDVGPIPTGRLWSHIRPWFPQSSTLSLEQRCLLYSSSFCCYCKQKVCCVMYKYHHNSFWLYEIQTVHDAHVLFLSTSLLLFLLLLGSDYCPGTKSQDVYVCAQCKAELGVLGCLWSCILTSCTDTVTKPIFLVSGHVCRGW